jgi:hypothetical protein
VRQETSSVSPLSNSSPVPLGSRGFSLSGSSAALRPGLAGDRSPLLALAGGATRDSGLLVDLDVVPLASSSQVAQSEYLLSQLRNLARLESCSSTVRSTCCYASTNRRSRRTTYPAVCSKRATLLGNVDRADRKLRCGRNRPSGWTLSVQVFGPGGTRSEYRSRIFWIDGRRTWAAAKAPQRKRPCRSRATARRSDPFLFRCAQHPFYGGSITRRGVGRGRGCLS